MKTLTFSVAATLLVGTIVELKTGHSKPVQSTTGRASQPVYTLKPISFGAVHHQHSASPRLRLWESTSSNWSGYAVPLEGGGVSDTFSDVQGTWTVPTVTGSGRSTAYSSAWVGIDGYNTGTVEQIGTEQDWSGGKQ